MVGPISSAERDSFAFRVKVGLTALIALSAGLIAVQTDAPLTVVLAAIAAGAVVGAPLVWFTIPGSGGRKQREQPERKFRK